MMYFKYLFSFLKSYINKTCITVHAEINYAKVSYYSLKYINFVQK